MEDSLDPRLLERTYVQLRKDVRRFVARRAPAEAVEDLTQEVFVKMQEHAAELRDAGRLVPWAFQITRNVITDHLRRRRPVVALEDIAEPAAEEAEEKNFNEAMASAFGPMLALLPEEYATALQLTELEGLTQRELAERMNLSLSGAKSRVQRGRALLESLIRACCDFDLDARGNVITCSPREGGPCRSC
jgi:RNA polymerase sigma-70 factor (ECF subfamily)